MRDTGASNTSQLCQCGCGGLAPIAHKTQTSQDAVAGQPQKYIFGHRCRVAEPALSPTVHDDAIYLPLRPQSANLFAIISPEDSDLARYNWCRKSKLLPNPVRQERHDNSTVNIYLHRTVVERIIGRGLQEDDMSDHKNGNVLDNRRDNLRLATPQQNAQNRLTNSRNTSGFRGVHYVRRSGHWQANICISRKIKCLGSFLTPEEASAAYERAATEYFGKFKREA